MHLLSLSHTGFAINTNILETNVLNLAVVIAFVYIYGGEVFRQNLNTRRERIIKTMANAEAKYKEAKAALKQAELKVLEAKYKSVSIRSDGRIFLKRLNILLLKEAREEEIRLRKTEYEKRLLVQKKSIAYIQTNLLKLIFAKAPNKFLKRFENIPLKKVASLYWIQTLSQRVNFK